MKRIKLKVLGLSYSQSQEGSYIIVLSEKKGRKLPIIIKPNEAQYIAIKMEAISSQRPLTQDLFKNIIETLGGDVQEVMIHNLAEGLFYAKFKITTANDEHEIECSVGDALSISLLYRCPIYTTSEIMEAAGILIEDNGTMSEEQRTENLKERDILKSTITVENLEQMLNNAIENQEFEVAAQIRDRINNLKDDVK